MSFHLFPVNKYQEGKSYPCARKKAFSIQTAHGNLNLCLGAIAFLSKTWRNGPMFTVCLVIFMIAPFPIFLKLYRTLLKN